MAQPRPVYTNPTRTRSLLVLAMAEELIRMDHWPHRQAQVRLQGQRELDAWQAVLYGSDGLSPIRQVAAREVNLAIINPGGPLALAVRGSPPFAQPLPLRIVSVIPSFDQLGFAVSASTGISSFRELRERRYPLRLAIRGGRSQ